MKPSIKLLFLLLLCSINNVALVAQSVNINTAKTIAKNHLISVKESTLKSTIGTTNFTSVTPEINNKDTLYYILNDTINKGFVIVSADQRAWPILAYSTERSFNDKNQPDALTNWMDNRKKEIEYIKKNDIQPNNAIISSWKNLSVKGSVIETTSVDPLIKTQWGQGCYYNSKCPTDAAGSCGHAYAGCTATAMAQIMKYWNFPTKGTGSHSYSHKNYGILSADFGSTTYQWSQMPNRITSQNDAVATLMYHCGVSLETDYGPEKSSAWDPSQELIKYFSYSSNSIMVSRDGSSTNDWTNLLRSELNLGHPIYYQGGGSVAHAFICDGYQNEDYFHFNWGWEGASDGYFYIGNLNPDWYNFDNDNFVIINLVPGDLPEGYKGFFLSSNELDLATEGDTTFVDICSSANWTALCDQSWLTLSKNTGSSGKTTITFTATENQSENDRSATVTISASGYNDQIITINQRTAVHVTPNGLYNAVSQNAVSIRKLKLKGSIDARDFKTMRDAMPSLTEVDLSDVTIVAYSGTEGTSGDNDITYPDNEIPQDAFYIPFCQGQNRFKTFVFPSTLKSVGSLAFGDCKYLTTLSIPATVTNVGDRAFNSCNALINVDANNPNYSSVDGVLFNKKQTELIVCPISKTGTYTIPSSVTNIAAFAFENCNNLTSIIIPSSVTSIASNAFSYCNNITSITIPSSVSSIEHGAFYSCGALINVDSNNPNYSSIDGILFNKEQSKLIHCPTSKTGTYTIPSSVTSLGENAFSNCIGLTNVIIPSTVNSIGDGAFLHSGLTTITIPESVTAIAPTSFLECYNLASASIPSSVISIGDYVFSDCEKLLSIYVHAIYPVDLTLSYNVFGSVNKNSCTLYVPYGAKDAYSAATQWKDFYNIVEMPGIFLSNNNIGMGPNVNTTPIIISSSLNWNATSDQEWLTIHPSSGTAGRDTINFTASAISTTDFRTATVTISATGIDSQTITVTQYGTVEVSAGNLKTVLAGQLSAITSLSLSGIIDARDFKTMRDEMPALTTIDLSDVTIAAYSGTEGTGVTNISFYEANSVPWYAFYDGTVSKTSLKSIILPASVTSIKPLAFKSCDGLSSINIPSQTTSIGYYAFSGCKGLTNITIPSSVVSISYDSFYMCRALFNVDKNNQNYSSIDGVLFNKKQTELLQFPALKTGNYTIPSSVISIGEYSFDYSTLQNISIPASVTTIGEFAFCNSTLQNISIPVSVTTIGEFAFGNCYELTAVTIPSSVTTIGEWALGSCFKLSTIYAYSASPVNLNSSPYVFANVDKNNCILYVPNGSKTAYSEADQWKDFVNIVEFPNEAPLANAGTDQTVYENSIFSLDGTTSFDPEGRELSYLWTIPAGFSLNSNTEPRPTVTAPEVSSDTTYTFSLVVNDGTIDSPEAQVKVTVLNAIETSVNEINNSNKYYIYPNPTTGLLKISMAGQQEQNYTIEVYDEFGQLKLIEEKVSGIDLSSFSNGIYFIKLNIKMQSYIQKIVKK